MFQQADTQAFGQRDGPKQRFGRPPPLCGFGRLLPSRLNSFPVSLWFRSV